MPRVADRNQMRLLLARWIAQHDDAGRPLGRWAIETRDSGLVVGAVALLPLPPGCTDLEIGWQITPAAWGHGYGAEAGHAVAHQAFANGVSEVFAVVRPGNTRGVATARRVGMEWVGETDKYYADDYYLHDEPFKLRFTVDYRVVRPTTSSRGKGLAHR